MFYHVAEASEYMVITGAGIEDMKISEEFVWPLQKCRRTSLSLPDLSFSLHAMTAGKLQFERPRCSQSAQTIGKRII